MLIDKNANRCSDAAGPVYDSAVNIHPYSATEHPHSFPIGIDPICVGVDAKKVQITNIP